MKYVDFVTGCADQGVEFYVPYEKRDTPDTFSSRFGKFLRDGTPITNGQIAIDGFSDLSTFFRQHAEIANSKLNPTQGHALAFDEGLRL